MKRLFLFLLLVHVPLLARHGRGSHMSTTRMTSSMRVSCANSIAIDSNSVALPSPTEADLDTGHVQQNGALRLLIYANSSWKVQVSSPDANMGTVDGSTKRLSDLKYRRSGSNSFRTLRQQTRTLVQSSQAVNGYPIDIDLRCLTSWRRNPPGHYEATITFTLTTQA